MRPQVGALTIFAVVIALTGLLLVGQALARQTFLDSVDHPTLRALGFGRAQLVAGDHAARGRWSPIAAALLAVVVAVAASPLTPIGVARNAEPDPGLFVRRPRCSGSASSRVLVAVLALAVAPGVVVHARVRGSGRPTRRRRGRRASLGGWACRVHRSLAGTGVRMALEPGRGRTAVPVRTTIVGAALAVATVVAALTFASSLDHLVSTPRLYGWSWDVRVETER